MMELELWKLAVEVVLKLLRPGFNRSAENGANVNLESRKL